MYDEFPGVSTPDVDSIESVPYNEDYSVDKEWFYEMDCDLHIIGPQYLTGWALSEEDIKELQTNVAPFFFQYGRGPEFAEEQGFNFLGLYPIFEKIAEVFQASDRYEQFKQLNNEFVNNIQSQLPKEQNKPSVGVISIGGESMMNAYKADNPGWGKRQYRTLQIKNAFTDQVPENQIYIETDFETLLEADPDIIFELSGFWNANSQEEFEETVVRQLENDPVASQVTAVQEGEVYVSGNNSQGPLLSMLQTEVLAKQMYPDVFGGPRSVYDIGTAPDEPLFDRQRVADIINGDF
jgi:iron complex transport system substrate-binding protein